jgi:hypothetical protein
VQNAPKQGQQRTLRKLSNQLPFTVPGVLFPPVTFCTATIIIFGSVVVIKIATIVESVAIVHTVRVAVVERSRDCHNVLFDGIG